MHNKKRLLFLGPAVLLFSLAFLAVVVFFGLEYYATTALKQEIDTQVKEISDYVRVEYDSLGVNWLAYTVDLKKVRLSKPPLPGSIIIDKVAVRDFTTIGIKWIPTVVVLDDITVTNEDFKLTAQRLATSFSLNRIPTEEEIEKNWRVLLDNLATGEVKLANLMFSDQETQFNIAKLKADYSLITGNKKNIGVNIQDLKLQNEDLRLTSDTFSLAASLDRNNVLNHVSKQVKDFSFQFPADLAKRNPFLQHLTALGYERLNFGVDLDYKYQPDTKNLNITWDGRAADVGRLQFELHLTDYQSPPVPVNGSLVKLLDYLERLRSPVQKASLQGFKAVYQDFGLAPRLIKAEAQAQGQSPEEFTRDIVGTINGTLALLPLPAAIKEQVNSVNRFLLNPQEIQLAITCKKPVRLKNLQEGSVSGFLELLGNTEIKITAK